MKYLICNLKTHKTYDEICSYKNYITSLNNPNLNLIVAPSIPYLSLFKSNKINLCSQDISIYNDLSLTGDISIPTLKSLDCNYVLVGHYERRKYYNENLNIILKKINTALENNIKVIYCIGETLEELNRKVEYQVLEKNIANIFNNIDHEDFSNIIIAYEPSYLIGTNKSPNKEKITDIISFIKKIIKDYYDETITVVFGGSITPENIQELNTIKDLDGYIMSSSALDTDTLTDIINNIN